MKIKILILMGAIIFLCLFGVSIASASIIHVPDDYPKIQWAVDNATAGDTIIVYNGTYNENINVNKQLILKGIDYPLVDASGSGSVIKIVADGCILEGFKAVNGGSGKENAGILVESDNNIIENNYCSLNNRGIKLTGSSNNKVNNNSCYSNSGDGINVVYSSNNNNITNNSCSGNYHGMSFGHFSEYNIIANNNFSLNSYDGLSFWNGSNSLIINNTVFKNNYGIAIGHSSYNNTITRNNCSHNSQGIHFVVDGSDNIVYLNNFIDNTDNVYSSGSTNIWNSTKKITYTYNGTAYENYLGNYWSDYKEKYPSAEEIDKCGIWDTPYSINSDNDNYPLMEKFDIFGTAYPTLTEECKKYIADYLGIIKDSQHCFSHWNSTKVKYWDAKDLPHNGSTLDAVVTIRFFGGYSYEDKEAKTGLIDNAKLTTENGGTALTDDDAVWIAAHSDGADKWCYTPWIPTFSIFDTGSGTYPSIFGTHNGTITPNQTITVSKLYTYPCSGTGGHTEYARIWNSTWNATATWDGYVDDWHNISFDRTVILMANETYNYTIHTGSYPQIIHEKGFNATGGKVTCTEFVDANGKTYNDWIPAIRLEEIK